MLTREQLLAFRGDLLKLIAGSDHPDPRECPDWWIKLQMIEGLGFSYAEAAAALPGFRAQYWNFDAAYAPTLSRFSFFERPINRRPPVTPARTVTVGEVHRLITGPRYRTVTHRAQELYRAQDKQGYSQLKRTGFDYVTFCGVFTERKDAGLIEHSQLLAFDFDHLANPVTLRDQLIHNKSFETVLCFISPSGLGLKWIIDLGGHWQGHPPRDWFVQVADYLERTYHHRPDPLVDVSRACFLSYDPSAYLNIKYENQKDGKFESPGAAPSGAVPIRVTARTAPT